MDAKRKFGGCSSESKAHLTDACLTLLSEELKPLIEQGLAAAVYPQVADVEIEFNGCLTYDRATPKMDERRTTEAHRALYRALGYIARVRPPMGKWTRHG